MLLFDVLQGSAQTTSSSSCGPGSCNVCYSYNPSSDCCANSTSGYFRLCQSDGKNNCPDGNHPSETCEWSGSCPGVSCIAYSPAACNNHGSDTKCLGFMNDGTYRLCFFESYATSCDNKNCYVAGGKFKYCSSRSDLVSAGTTGTAGEAFALSLTQSLATYTPYH